MLWLVGLWILSLLLIFYMIWKREGIIHAILNLVSIVCFYFTFSNPFRSSVSNGNINLPVLFIAFISVATSFVLWLRYKRR